MLASQVNGQLRNWHKTKVVNNNNTSSGVIYRNYRLRYLKDFMAKVTNWFPKNENISIVLSRALRNIIFYAQDGIHRDCYFHD